MCVCVNGLITPSAGRQQEDRAVMSAEEYVLIRMSRKKLKVKILTICFIYFHFFFHGFSFLQIFIFFIVLYAKSSIMAILIYVCFYILKKTKSI